MRKLKGIVLAATVTLLGCHANDNGTQGVTAAKSNYRVPPIPTQVSQAMATTFPDDGQVHVLVARGRFEIKQDTVFCSFPKVGRLNNQALDELFLKLGQPREFESQKAGNQWRGNPEFWDGHGGWVECQTGKPIASYGQIYPNRSGKPYKLVLAVWQGDSNKDGAIWIAGIEQNFDPNNADTWGKIPYRLGGPVIGDAVGIGENRVNRLFIDSVSDRHRK